jgi:hypothetical protein
MDKYIGFKLIQAEPMNEGKFRLEKGFTDVSEELLKTETYKEGYKVVYPDGYTSWSPKEVFEKAYMKVGNNNTITQDNVDSFIDYYDYCKMGEKTTVVKATLINEFVIVESSSCVDVANYDDEIGRDICKDRIKNKVWELLGFLLQTAKSGIK